jgi:fermentation-respiration switch protein FrsA (DUF1100 family)
MRRVLEDAWTVLAYAHALAAAPLIVMGRSLGSAPCWEVASASCVRAVIVDSGFTSVEAFARRRGVDPATLSSEERALLDPLPKIARVSAPTLLLHGENDTVIAHAEAVRALAASNDREPIDDDSAAPKARTGQTDGETVRLGRPAAGAAEQTPGAARERVRRADEQGGLGGSCRLPPAAPKARQPRLATIPGCGHNDLSMHPAYWQALAPFLDAQS